MLGRVKRIPNRRDCGHRRQPGHCRHQFRRRGFHRQLSHAVRSHPFSCRYTGNGVLLLLGSRLAKNHDAAHPFGYGMDLFLAAGGGDFDFRSAVACRFTKGFHLTHPSHRKTDMELRGAGHRHRV